jgi:hypothetical protein
VERERLRLELVITTLGGGNRHFAYWALLVVARAQCCFTRSFVKLILSYGSSNSNFICVY